MSQATHTIDGSRTTDQQENDLNLVEGARHARITRYEKGSTAPNNVVTFEFLPRSAPELPALQLTLAVAGATPAGGQLVFEANVYVEGEEKAVIGYRAAASSAGG